MNQTEPVIPEEPAIAYDVQAAEEIIVCAESYLKQADRLIYSYGSRTFLSGYPVFDAEYENRGNIDCSSFVLLVLALIPYEESPYATGTSRNLDVKMKRELPKEVIDFSNLPKRYVDIAERIGRPYLAGPKGLDLNKAEKMGISADMLKEEIRAAGGRIFSADREVVHVGIVSRDTSRMINSSGTSRKSADKKTMPAVSSVPLFGTRKPAFFARPEREMKGVFIAEKVL